MVAKKASNQDQVGPPADETCGSAEPTTVGEATTTPASSPQPAGAEQQPAHNMSNELQRINLLADIMGRTYRALTRCVTHEQKIVRVLGVITWVFLLAVPASGVVVLIVLVFRLDPVHTAFFLAGSTFLVAGANGVNVRRRK